MLEIFLTVVHVVVCLFLIIVVLLQSGKAADLAGAFGGMGSQTAFGPRGAATMLSKATTFAAVVFMLTSIWLGIERTGTGAAAPETSEPVGAPQAQEETGQQSQDSLVVEQKLFPDEDNSQQPASSETPRQE